MSPEQHLSGNGCAVINPVPPSFTDFDAFSDRSPAYHAQPLKYVSFLDVEPSLDASDFVEDLLTEGAMSVIYGESNCGKTFLALDLALHVATGTPWYGREITAGPVLYLALEGSSGIRNRIVAYRNTHGVDTGTTPFALVPQGLNLLDPEGDIAAIIATAERVTLDFKAPLKLLIIDTLSRAMAGGNENAPEDMTKMVAAGDRIRQETGAHVMWIHHCGKDAAKGARGHSSLRAATDTEIEVISEANGRRAEVRKQRDLAGGDTFNFSLESVELGTNTRGKPVSSCVVRADTDGQARTKDPASSLTAQQRRAHEILVNTVTASGQRGIAGVPDGFSSIPEDLWRQEFYAAAMPGDKQDTKLKAFKRASTELLNKHIVAMMGGRVWLTINA
jgi:hypothetical protein